MTLTYTAAPTTEFDVDKVLALLTRQEKIDLLSGIDFWHTKAIPRLGVPSIRVSDGPNGVRGTRFFNGVPAACFPCGTALASTWNMPLLREAGAVMGEETKAKGAHVLLGPTVNMQRSPLGGRGFESFSEDPILAGSCAAAVVNGIQETGVAATIKHFVGNEQEHQRMAVNSIVTERALREIYLLPFQIAARDSKPKAFMTSYNKINGTHVSESTKFLEETLRGEWRWDGTVMSDWYGTYSASEAVNAGLDLEMPGPSRWRGQLLLHALMSNKVSPHTVDRRVKEVLKLVNHVAKTPVSAKEGSRDTPETAEMLRKLAAESIVLLKNENKVLPLKDTMTVAVIGPNAKVATFCGGGSAAMLPYYAVTPFDGISSKAKDVKYSLGCFAHKQLPLLGPHLRTVDGKVGVTFKAFTDPPSVKDRKPVDVIQLVDTNMYLVDYYHPKLGNLYWAEVEGNFTPDEDGVFEFGLTVFGLGKLYLDDELVVDNETVQRPGGTFFNVGTVEEIGSKKLRAGQCYKLRVDFASGVTSKLNDADGVVSFGGGGIRIGGARAISPEEEIEKAVQLAKEVDQVVLCVGLNNDWEQEGHDREHMDLPGYSNDLISAVIAVNPNAVVVIQSGTPIRMPWADKVSTLVQAWYGGNETGNAIADVLFGAVNPSGKLCLSFPLRNEDNPAFLNYRSERGRVVYGEDIYVGYRFYEATKKDVLFPFGHGLSYTTFSLSKLAVSHDEATSTLKVSVALSNTGSHDGAEVIQVYISQLAPSIKRPPKELKGFAKRHIKAGATENVEIAIPVKYAASFWDEGRDEWTMEKDSYVVFVGTSSADTPLKGSFEVKETSWWKGL